MIQSDRKVMFLPTLASNVHQKFKQTVVKVVWHNLGNARATWFTHIDETRYQYHETQSGFHIEHHICEFRCGIHVCRAMFNEKEVFSSFYKKEGLYEALGREMCIVLDIVNAMSGSEAVVESYYSVMKSQTQSGGQSNYTLVQRTNVDWCFPPPFQCEETIK